MNQEEARRAFQKASEFWRSGRYEDALSLLEAVEKVTPDNPDVVYAKAKCLKSLGRIEDALRASAVLKEKLGDPRGATLGDQLGQQILAQSAVAAKPKRGRGKLWAGIAVALIVAIVGGVATYYFVIFPILYRQVTFRASESVGRLYVRNPDLRETEWRELGDAIGVITLTRPLQLKLVVQVKESAPPGEQRRGIMRSPPEIRALAALGPDDLQALDLAGIVFSSDIIRRIRHFSTLLELDLSSTDISDKDMDAVGEMIALTTLNLEGTSIGNRGLAWIATLPRLRKLDLRNTRVGDSGIRRLSASASLRDLYLPEGITDDGIEGLAQMTSLVRLHAARSAVTDEGAKALAGLQRLRRLSLRSTLLTDKGVALLAVLPKLEHLDLSYTRITDVALGHVAKIGTLQELLLTGTGITDRGPALLAPLRQLATLDLGSCGGRPRIAGAGLAGLAAMPKLRDLVLLGANLDDDDLAAFEEMALTRLDLRFTEITGEGQTRLRRLIPNCDITFESREGTPVSFPTDISLGSIWIREERVGAPRDWALHSPAQGEVTVPPGHVMKLSVPVEAVEHLDRFPTMDLSLMRGLEIEAGGAVAGTTLAFIQGLTALESLELSGTTAGESGLGFLAGLSSLRVLHLSKVGLNDAAVEGVEFPMSLVEVDLSGNPLGNETLSRLAGLPALARLFLQDTALTGNAAGILGAMNALTYVDVSGTGMGPNDVESLRAQLPATRVVFRETRIETIRFPGNITLGILWTRPPESDASRDWVMAGPARGSVKVPLGHALRLDVNDEGLTALASLSGLLGARLHTLRLVGTQCTDENLAGLEGLVELKALDLFGTKVGAEGMATVANLLGLASLSLASTEVDDGGVARLTRLEDLRELDLANTSVTDAAAESIRRLSSLESLYLDGSRVTQDGIDWLEQSLPSCRVVGSLAARARETGSRTRPARVLRVKSRLSLGTLWMRPEESPDDEPWTEVGPLCGEVPIPAGMDVKLFLPTESSLNLAGLTDLAPGALQAIEFEKGMTVRATTLAPLRGMTDLRVVALDHTRIEEGALRSIEGMQSIIELGMYKAEMAEDELAALRLLPALERLDLTNTALTDETMAHLASPERITDLDLGGNKNLTDGSLAYTAPLEDLESLNLSRTAVSGAGLTYIGAHERLRKLHLYGSGVTQADLESHEELAGVEEVRVDTAVLSAHEIEDLRESIRDLAETEEGITKEGLSALVLVQSLKDVASESLRMVQRIALFAMAEEDEEITSEAMAEVAGADDLGDVAPEELPGLQEIALAAIATTEEGVTTEALVEVAGVEDFDDVAPEGLEALQTLALSAMADSEVGITSELFAELEGVASFEEVNEDRLDALQTSALSAMANSETGVTTEGLVEVVGAEDFEEIDEQQKTHVQRVALSAMADSRTGITSESIAELDGVETFEAVSEADLELLQRMALSAMAGSNTGITASVISELGGAEAYDELLPERMESLQRVALSTMAVSDTGITVRSMAQIGGANTFEAIPTERLDKMQTFALLAMSNSMTGITTRGIAVVGGKENFEELKVERLEPLQTKALTVMADSDTGITEVSLAVVSGIETYDAIPDETMIGLASRTLTAMAKSVKGIQVDTLQRLVGHVSMETVSFAYTNVTDSDFVRVADLSVVRYADLSGCFNITDGIMAYLSGATQLETLLLADTQITESALVHLASISTLKELDLTGTAITDEGLQYIAPLKALERLSLQSTIVTGSGFTNFAGLTALRSLDVSESKVTDRGLSHLSTLIGMVELNLGYTQTTNRGLEHLRTLVGLRTLELHDCPNLTDEGMQHLSTLAALERLTLHATTISDGSLPYLSPLTSLQALYLNYDTFGNSSVKALKRELPQCIIRRVKAVSTLRPGFVEEEEEEIEKIGPVTFDRLPVVWRVFQFAYLSGVILTMGASFVVPFVPYFIRIRAWQRLRRFTIVSAVAIARSAAYASVSAVRAARAMFFSFWGLLLIVLGLILAYFFYLAIIYVFDRLIDIIRPG